MMQVDLPYGSQDLHFALPAERLLGVYAPHDVPVAEDVAGEVARALANPSSGPTLSVLARGARHVVIVADDNTRPTPVHVIIPLLLDALNAAGIPDGAIEVLIALGTHRAMTCAEIDARFGVEVSRRVRIANHEPFDPGALADLGTTESGISVQVNRRVLEADLVLGVGSIVPHHIPGFSGGAKIIQPGVCGEHTTGLVHLLSVRRERSLLGVLENEVRWEMETIAARAGLRAILNTVLDRRGRVVGVVYGEPRGAFRAGVALCRQVYGVSVPQQADIVVAGSHPCDSEFWQAHKTLYAAELVVRRSGTIIIVTPCNEGLAASHPDLQSFAGRSYEEIDALLRSGQIRDLTAGALALAWANTRRWAKVALVSQGLSALDVQALGFVPFASIEEALSEACARYGQEATVNVLPYAPDTLPLLP
jgi:lactate racemase